MSKLKIKQDGKIGTDVYASNRTEIHEGDRIEVVLPPRSIFSELLLAKGIVYFEHGSFRIRKENGYISDRPRLDDFAPDCIIKIL